MNLNDKEILIKIAVACYMSLYEKIEPAFFQDYLLGILNNEHSISSFLRKSLNKFIEDLETNIYLDKLPNDSIIIKKHIEDLLQYVKLRMKSEVNILKSEIQEKLLLLLADVVSRKNISDWAIEELLKNENVDELERNYLIKLAAIDLINQETQSYVDSDNEITQWLIELK